MTLEERYIEKRICDFFNLDISKLRELKKTKDLYSAISEMTGLTRNQVKLQIHGFSYNIGKDSFNVPSN